MDYSSNSGKSSIKNISVLFEKNACDRNIRLEKILMPK